MVISIAIKTLIDAGYKMQKAYDSILGEGEYEKMTDSIYYDLKKAA